MSIQFLQWDSDFFECGVARLCINNECPIDFIKRELIEYENSNLDIMYICVKHNSNELVSFLSSIGAVLYDHKVSFKKNLLTRELDDSDNAVTELKQLTQEAVDIAVSSGIYSRFYLDPRFKPKQPLLYKQWISNCFEHRDSRVFGIIKDDILSAIAGVSVSGGTGHLELIAVAPNYRRHGFAKRLIKRAERFYLDSNVSTAEVVTQLNNTAACSTYHSCGYALIETVDVWHLWKNDLIAKNLR